MRARALCYTLRVCPSADGNLNGACAGHSFAAARNLLDAFSSAHFRQFASGEGRSARHWLVLPALAHLVTLQLCDACHCLAPLSMTLVAVGRRRCGWAKSRIVSICWLSARRAPATGGQRLGGGASGAAAKLALVDGAGCKAGANGLN